MKKENLKTNGEETPTQPASDRDLKSLISQSGEEESVVRVCRSCLLPQENENDEFCGKCGEKLVSIKKAKDPYIGTLVGEKYTVVKKIGQGGMGEVYLAKNDTLGQKVAIKFLIKRFADDENLVLRFLNEARSYCRVAHPNAVTLLEFGQHELGSLYIITEFVEGMSITETLKDSGLMSLEQTVDIGIQIAEVLSAAHEQGVIHRDLKPDNIMLTPTKRGRFVVKVLDFGIAKIVDDENGPATETGSVFGTPEFMSPEQARGDVTDGRADIYAFGIILFFLLTGKLPFKGENKLMVLNKQLHERPPKLADVRPGMVFSKGIESIIMKCLEKTAIKRFQNAEAVLEALESFRIDDGAFLTSMSTASSESTLGGNKKIQALDTVRLGGESPETFATKTTSLDSPFDDKIVAADLHSIEMWREAPTKPPVKSESSQTKPIGLWIALFITLGVIVFATISFSSSTEEVAPYDFDAVFNEGQTLGVISVAEGLLEDGKTRDALAALRKAKDLASTNEQTKERVSRLNDRAIEANLLFIRFQKASCSEEISLERLKEISKGLFRRVKRYRKKKCQKKKGLKQIEKVGGSPKKENVLPKEGVKNTTNEKKAPTPTELKKELEKKGVVEGLPPKIL